MRTPQAVGPYPVVRVLGAGGMGVVYQVNDLQFGRHAALKVIRSQGASKNALERFWREAEALAQINHAGVVKIHKTGRAAEGPYLLEEFIEGEVLSDLIERGTVAPLEAARLVADLADAVEAVHARGILHRDLKPANVIVRKETGKPVLLDFGLARDVNAETLTVTGQLLGTPSYMSPEQARGASSKDLGPGVDVHALGAILFALLVGRPPFGGDSAFVLLKQIIGLPAPSPREANPEVPASLDAICRVAMAKEASERQPSAADLRDDLRAFLRGESTESERRLGRGRRVGLLLSPLIVLLLGAGAFLGSRLGETLAPAPSASASRPRASASASASAAPPALEPLWRLASGDSFAFELEVCEDDDQIDWQVRSQLKARVGERVEKEPHLVELRCTIDWINAEFGSAASVRLRYDTRARKEGHPLERLDLAAGRTVTLQIDPSTGHVARVSGAGAIYSLQKRAGFNAGGIAAQIGPAIRFAFSQLFSNRFFRQTFDALLHAGGGACSVEVVPWKADPAPAGGERRFRVQSPSQSRAINPTSTHFSYGKKVGDGTHAFSVDGQSVFRDGRLQSATLTQTLIGPKPKPRTLDRETGDVLKLTYRLVEP